jgi:hypothetical protein
MYFFFSGGVVMGKRLSAGAKSGAGGSGGVQSNNQASDIGGIRSESAKVKSQRQEKYIKPLYRLRLNK